jgi:hypothetical protein
VFDAVERLIQQQKEVRAERKRVAAELKNAVRRKQRLKHRARLLSSEDLLSVMNMREWEENKKKGRKAQTADVEEASEAEAAPPAASAIIEDEQRAASD